MNDIKQNPSYTGARNAIEEIKSSATRVPPTVDLPEIPRVVNDLDNTVDELEKAFIRLGEKLEPVTRRTDETIDVSGYKDQETLLGGRLETIRHRLAALTSRVCIQVDLTEI